MPDKNGKLTPEEKVHATRWLNERGVNAKCPCCKPGQLQLVEYAVRLPIYTPGTLMVGGPEIPNILLVCPNCGYSQHHNAILIGLVEGDEKDKKSREGTS